MLKVLIADDEKKVCKLIAMLCDWEKLGIEIAGFAYNGIEALEKLESLRPDILITDVRMPGMDGIDLIRQISEKECPVEVVIISGYADFSYAQSAMRYGVGSYLLKPIKKEELEETLQKLAERCQKEQARLEASRTLMQYLEDDTQRRRCSLLVDLLTYGTKRPLPAIEAVSEHYAFHFEEGFFRILVLKLDYKRGKYTRQAVEKILAGLVEILRSRLKDVCTELEFWTDGAYTWVVCNYPEDAGHLFRQAVRSAADQIEVKRFQLWETRYSMGMGIAVRSCSKLEESLASAKIAVAERLLEGCEKLLEPPVRNTPPGDYSDYTAVFQYDLRRAMEMQDETMAAGCAEKLRDSLLHEKGITGTELLETVIHMGTYAIINAHPDNQTERISEFQDHCDLCYSAEVLFELLASLLEALIQEQRLRHEEESRRPIRNAKLYIMNHFTEPITLEAVAASAGFSSSYFSSLFKKETGKSFSEYLTELRVDRAKELLKNTKTNIRDICELVGYSDQKHFNATFRKYTGLKPGEYRKLYG